jgi:hypothetical protein
MVGCPRSHRTWTPTERSHSGPCHPRSSIAHTSQFWLKDVQRATAHADREPYHGHMTVRAFSVASLQERSLARIWLLVLELGGARRASPGRIRRVRHVLTPVLPDGQRSQAGRAVRPPCRRRPTTPLARSPRDRLERRTQRIPRGRCDCGEHGASTSGASPQLCQLPGAAPAMVRGRLLGVDRRRTRTGPAASRRSSCGARHHGVEIESKPPHCGADPLWGCLPRPPLEDHRRASKLWLIPVTGGRGTRGPPTCASVRRVNCRFARRGRDR